MNWIDIAKKNINKKVDKKEKKEKEKVAIDLYPEDLFEMRHMDDIRDLNQDFNEEIYRTGAELLNYNYDEYNLYDFIVYYTNLNPFMDELLNENSENEEDIQNNLPDIDKKNIVLYKENDR